MHVRTLTRLVVVAGFVFIVISAVSFFVLSDGHGVTQVHDGIKRVGWPLLMFEEGGFVWRREFYLKALAGNLVFAGCFAAVLCIGWHFIRRKMP